MGVFSSNVEVELTTLNCGNCGGVYALNKQYQQHQYEVGGSWHCPYCGISWGYGNNNENAELRKQLEKEEKRRERAEKRAEHAFRIERHTEKRRIAQKAATTRLRNRIKEGLCPQCNQHFEQLSEHISTMHPEHNHEKTS